MLAVGVIQDYVIYLLDKKFYIFVEVWVLLWGGPLLVHRPHKLL